MTSIVKIKVTADTGDAQSKLQGSVSGLQKIQSAMLALNAIPFAGQLLSGLTELDTGLRNVATLMDETASVTLPRMEQGLRAMSDVPLSFGELTEGMYDLQSAGHGNEKMFEALRIASYAAMGGLTSVKDAADLGTTVLNAYKLKTSELTDVYDTMFNTVKLGKTTMPELSQSIGHVVSTANMAKIPLKELMASIATLTLAGIKTPRAMAAMNQGIRSLDAPATSAKKRFKEMGIEIDLRSDGLIKTLGKLRAANLSAEDWKKIVPSARASKAIQALVNQFDKLVEVRSRMDKTGETARAFKIQKESIENQLKSLKKVGLGILIDVGKAVLPVLKPIAEIAKTLNKLFSAIPKPMRDMVVQAIAFKFAMGGLLSLAGAKGIAAMTTGMFGLRAATASTIPPIQSLSGKWKHLNKSSTLPTAKMMGLGLAIAFTVNRLSKLLKITKDISRIENKQAADQKKWNALKVKSANNAQKFAKVMLKNAKQESRSFVQKKTALKAISKVQQGLFLLEQKAKKEGGQGAKETISKIHETREKLNQYKTALQDMSQQDYTKRTVDGVTDLSLKWQGAKADVQGMNAEMQALNPNIEGNIKTSEKLYTSFLNNAKAVSSLGVAILSNADTGTRSFGDLSDETKMTCIAIEALQQHIDGYSEAGKKAGTLQRAEWTQLQNKLQIYKENLLNVSNTDFAARPISQTQEIGSAFSALGVDITGAQNKTKIADFSSFWTGPLNAIGPAVASLIQKFREMESAAVRAENAADDATSGESKKPKKKTTSRAQPTETSSGGGGGGGSMQQAGLSAEEQERVKAIMDRFDADLSAHRETVETELKRKNKEWENSQDSLDKQLNEGLININEYNTKTKAIAKEKINFLEVAASLELGLEKRRVAELHGVTSEAEKTFLNDVKRYSKEYARYKGKESTKEAKIVKTRLKAAEKILSKWRKDNIKGLNAFNKKKKDITKKHNNDVERLNEESDKKIENARKAQYEKMAASAEHWGGVMSGVFTSLGETIGQWLRDSSTNFKKFWQSMGGVLLDTLTAVIKIQQTKARAAAIANAMLMGGGIFAGIAAGIQAGLIYEPLLLIPSVLRGTMQLAEGGLIATPGGITAQIGEAGRELAIPLDNPRALSGVKEMLGKMGVTNQSQAININSPVLLSDSEIAMNKFTKTIAKSMRKQKRLYGN